MLALRCVYFRCARGFRRLSFRAGAFFVLDGNKKEKSPVEGSKERKKGSVSIRKRRERRVQEVVQHCRREGRRIQATIVFLSSCLRRYVGRTVFLIRFAIDTCKQVYFLMSFEGYTHANAITFILYSANYINFDFMQNYIYRQK